MPKCLQGNFIEITLRQGCCPVNLMHILEHLFLRTTLDGCFCNCKKQVVLQAHSNI